MQVSYAGLEGTRDNNNMTDAIETKFSNTSSVSITTSNEIIRCTIINTPNQISHALLFTKHLPGLKIEGDSVLHHQKNLYAI